MTPGERRRVTRVSGKYESGEERPESYQMTLPKWWCRMHNFPEEVDVELLQGGDLLVKAVR